MFVFTYFSSSVSTSKTEGLEQNTPDLNEKERLPSHQMVFKLNIH